jgi:hypothetical protein
MLSALRGSPNAPICIPQWIYDSVTRTDIKTSNAVGEVA